MTEDNINRRNQYIARLHSGEILSDAERAWMMEHPIFSSRYHAPWIIADFLSLEPSKTYAITIQCQHADPKHPIVPTFTIPFETGGFVQLAAVVNSGMQPRNMKQSTKLSFRMLPGITAVARCQSDSGLLMVSYQGWVPDNKPMPLWYECIQCDRFSMQKEIVSENMIIYRCCGADGTEDVFRFLVNWYEVNEKGDNHA